MKSCIQTAKIFGISLLLCGSMLVQPLVVATALAKVSPRAASPVHEEIIDGKKFLVIRSMVKARPDQVWQVLADYPNSTRVFPLLKKCQILKDHGSTKIMRHVVAPSGLALTYDYVIAVKETAPSCIEWHRIRGAFKELEGSWKLEPRDSGRSTLVTYASYINGGFFLPQSMIRRQIQIDMPITIAALKLHTESMTQIASRRVDNHKEQ